MQMTNRSTLHFVQEVRDAFGFLSKSGFDEVEASPTLVRYRKGGVEIDIYHGRHSYEVSGGVTVAGTRYAVSEVIRAVDPSVAKEYRNSVATTAEEITSSLQRLAAILKRYGADIMNSEQRFVVALANQRKAWGKAYALEVLAAQLRPQAEDAFRRGDYRKASELYAQIRECLTPAEIKKLSIAQARSSGLA